MTLSFVLSTIHFFYTTLYTIHDTVLSLFIVTSTLSLYYLYTDCFVSVHTEQYMLYYSMLCFAMLCSTILMIYLLCYTSYAIICHVILLFFNRTSWSPAIWTQTVPTSAEQRCPPSLSAGTATIVGWSTTPRTQQSAPRTVLTTGALWRVKFWIR